MKLKKLIPMFFLCTLLLSSCSSKNTSSTKKSDTESPKPSESPKPAESSKPRKLANLYVDFKAGASSYFEPSNGWSNGSMFNCTWRSANCTFEDSVMKLTINKDLETSSTPYSGSEYRSKAHYWYGSYEVSMKPIKNDGVVSSFFTYTGPSEGNPWDEIDIEFLGKDTTKVQFNYFTNSRGSHEYVYDLGFDAAEEFHTYGFVWAKDSVTWYVDEKAVYTATNDIPTTPSKVMMNVWPGKGVDSWLKPFDGKVPLHAEYKFLKVVEAE